MTDYSPVSTSVAPSDMTSTAARAAGFTRFIGEVCAKHPEREGLRYSRNHSCVYCVKAYTKKWNAGRKAKQAKKRIIDSAQAKAWAIARTLAGAGGDPNQYMTAASKLVEDMVRGL